MNIQTLDVAGEMGFLPLTKRDIHQLARQKAAEVSEAGSADPLRMVITAKRYAEFFGEFEKALKPEAMKEAAKYSKGERVFGAKVEIAEVGVSYDYSRDQKWLELQKHIEAYREIQKEWETYLKTLKVPVEIAEADTGEVRRHVPPIRTGSETLKITL